MAIGWPEAIDAAPARRPERSGGWLPGDFLVSRGMGAAQGKKVDRRHCGIGDRGEAGLRPDQPITEAAWSARSDRDDQGEPGASIVQPRGTAWSVQGAHPASRRPAASMLPMSRDRRATSPLPSRAWRFVAPPPRSNADRDRWVSATQRSFTAKLPTGEEEIAGGVISSLAVAGTASGARRALAGATGRGQRRQPREGGDADDKGSDQRIVYQFEFRLLAVSQAGFGPAENEADALERART